MTKTAKNEWRCHTCGTVHKHWAAAERCAHAHHGARIEIEAGSEQ